VLGRRRRHLVEAPLEHAAHDRDAPYGGRESGLLGQRERDVRQRSDRHHGDLPRLRQDDLNQQVDRARPAPLLASLCRQESLALPALPVQGVPVEERAVGAAADEHIEPAGGHEHGLDHARSQRRVDIDGGHRAQVDRWGAQQEAERHDIVHIRPDVRVQNDKLPLRVHKNCRRGPSSSGDGGMRLLLSATHVMKYRD